MAANSWLNNDGLYVKYGTSEATVGIGGVFDDAVGNLHILEFRIPDLTVLTTTSAILDDNIYLPKGCRIEKVQVVNDVAATSSGAATLSVGTIRSDRTTAVAAAGVLSVAPLADWDTLGEAKEYGVGVTGAGTLVGAATVGANPTLITAKYTTAAFTAGALTVRIFYKFP